MMKKVMLWSAVILFIILLYIGATIFFAFLFRQSPNIRDIGTAPTAGATFTPTFEPTEIVIEATPIPVEATATATVRPTEPINPTATPTDEPAPILTSTATNVVRPSEVVAATIVNVRAGPGLNYDVIASIPPNVPFPIVGRNSDRSWWLIEGADGNRGWVADLVVETSNTNGIPVAAIPPTATSPPATATPIPPTSIPPTAIPITPKPAYQYEPTGWFDDTNYGLTRFLGSITDVNGNAVDGVRVEAQCGSYRVISNPSGPVVFKGESGDWPPGFYDLTLDTRPIPCKWFLTIVESPDGVTVTGRLSEAVEIETTVDSSIVTANWRKNW